MKAKLEIQSKKRTIEQNGARAHLLLSHLDRSFYSVESLEGSRVKTYKRQMEQDESKLKFEVHYKPYLFSGPQCESEPFCPDLMHVTPCKRGCHPEKTYTITLYRYQQLNKNPTSECKKKHLLVYASFTLEIWAENCIKLQSNMAKHNSPRRGERSIWIPQNTLISAKTMHLPPWRDHHLCMLAACMGRLSLHDALWLGSMRPLLSPTSSSLIHYVPPLRMPP